MKVQLKTYLLVVSLVCDEGASGLCLGEGVEEAGEAQPPPLT